jgi:hypothetical protein
VNVAIDWSGFDDLPELTCTCRCGASFRSHARTVQLPRGWSLIARKACPNCGGVDMGRASSDVERMTIGASPTPGKEGET